MKCDYILNTVLVTALRSNVDAKERGSLWTCLCGPDGFPKVAVGGHNPNCFNACDCTWGIFLLSLLSKTDLDRLILNQLLLFMEKKMNTYICKRFIFWFKLQLHYNYRNCGKMMLILDTTTNL